MAMLAEPRRKKRSINLRGKNNWSDDPDKFGSKLMQKMGWTPGKGLGLNEDGKVDNVKVRFKDDNGGVGFADKNDQWTSHETNFEELLRNLHGGIVDKSKLHSESSLEEKSKKLSSRLHYKKFTRGKDITRYSNKDLANIFGKKTLNHQDEKQVHIDDPATEERNQDTKLIAGGCMKDYFQSKLGKRLGKTSQMINNFCESTPNLLDDDESYVAFKGFSSSQTKTTPTDAITGNGMNDHAYTPYNSADRCTNDFKNFSQATKQATASIKYVSFSKASDVDPNKQKISAKVTKLVEENNHSQIVSKKKKKKASGDASHEPLQLDEEVSVNLSTEQSAFASNDSEVIETISRKSKKIKKKKFRQPDENNSTASVSVIETGEDVIVTKTSKKNKQTKVCLDGKASEAIMPHLNEVFENSEEVSIHKMEDKTSKKKKKMHKREEKTASEPISEACKEELKQKRKAETPTENEPDNIKLPKKKKNRGVVVSCLNGRE